MGFYALAFSSICPWALLVGGVGLLIMYLRVGMLLAVRYNRPRAMGDAIARMTELMLPIAIFGHYFAMFFLLCRWLLQKADYNTYEDRFWASLFLWLYFLLGVFFAFMYAASGGLVSMLWRWYVQSKM